MKPDLPRRLHVWFASIGSAPGRPFSLFGPFVVLAVWGAVLLTGCVDSVISTDDPVAARPAVGHMGPQFRHAHLLDRAIQPIPGKSSSAQALGLIVGFRGGIEKQKIIERYKISHRYKIEERYRFNHVFYGVAGMVDDSTGSADFQDFLDSLALDQDILWIEPAFDVTVAPSDAELVEAGQMVPWSVAATGGMSSWTHSGDGQGWIDVDLYVLDTGVSSNDLNIVERLDFCDGTLVLL